MPLTAQCEQIDSSIAHLRREKNGGGTAGMKDARSKMRWSWSCAMKCPSRDCKSLLGSGFAFLEVLHPLGKGLARWDLRRAKTSQTHTALAREHKNCSIFTCTNSRRLSATLFGYQGSGAITGYRQHATNKRIWAAGNMHICEIATTSLPGLAGQYGKPTDVWKRLCKTSATTEDAQIKLDLLGPPLGRHWLRSAMFSSTQ